MTNVAAQVGGSRHESERCDGKNQNNRQIPASQTRNASQQPECKQGEESSYLHECEPYQRGAFVSIDQRGGDAGTILDSHLGIAAADVNSNNRKSTRLNSSLVA